MMPRLWKRKQKKVRTLTEQVKKANGHAEDDDFFEDPEDEVLSLKADKERLERELKSALCEIGELKEKNYKQQEWTQNLVMQLITIQASKPRSMVEEYIAKKQGGLAAIDEKAKKT